MTLREFIEILEELASGIPEGDQIEVVALNSDTDEPYTPVVSVGQHKDGVRRCHVG